MVFSYDDGGTQNIFSLFWEVSLLQESFLIDLGYCMIKSPWGLLQLDQALNVDLISGTPLSRAKAVHLLRYGNQLVMTPGILISKGQPCPIPPLALHCIQIVDLSKMVDNTNVLWKGAGNAEDWTKSGTQFFFFEPKHTPGGKEMVTGVQVVTASQVQSIRGRW